MQQPGQSGKLKLFVIEAKLTRDTETFGKMDPYCIVTYRQDKFRTPTKDGAGKVPKWDFVIDINVKYIGDDMTL